MRTLYHQFALLFYIDSFFCTLSLCTFRFYIISICLRVERAFFLCFIFSILLWFIPFLCIFMMLALFILRFQCCNFSTCKERQTVCPGKVLYHPHKFFYQLCYSKKGRVVFRVSVLCLLARIIGLKKGQMRSTYYFYMARQIDSGQ